MQNIKIIENISASSLTNYLLNHDLLKNQLTNLYLQKVIYLIHGFTLAIENISIINHRFDERIEAWRLGIVIPSIYHEFKHLANDKINNDAKSILALPVDSNLVEFYQPKLSNKTVESICNWVIENIITENGKLRPASKLFELTHLEGSPWHQVFQAGKKHIEIENDRIQDYFIWYREWLQNKGIVYNNMQR